MAENILNDLGDIAKIMEQLDYITILHDNAIGKIHLTAWYNDKLKKLVDAVDKDDGLKWTVERKRIDVGVSGLTEFDKVIVIFHRQGSDELGIETQRLAEFIEDFLDHFDEIDDV